MNYLLFLLFLCSWILCYLFQSRQNNANCTLNDSLLSKINKEDRCWFTIWLGDKDLKFYNYQKSWQFRKMTIFVDNKTNIKENAPFSIEYISKDIRYKIVEKYNLRNTFNFEENYHYYDLMKYYLAAQTGCCYFDYDTIWINPIKDKEFLVVSSLEYDKLYATSGLFCISKNVLEELLENAESIVQTYGFNTRPYAQYGSNLLRKYLQHYNMEYYSKASILQYESSICKNDNILDITSDTEIQKNYVENNCKTMHIYGKKFPDKYNDTDIIKYFLDKDYSTDKKRRSE
eukprot:c20734_g1_i1.p1 GENE.c20734_g1_i1~~c20734_g1_i1.p1  ORF type:complete len:288 (+),score=34.60 c20734_g1_i1:108-971(+)